MPFQVVTVTGVTGEDPWKRRRRRKRRNRAEKFLRADIQTDINGSTTGPRGHKKLLYAHKI